jgi:hypothetical protein
MEVQIYIYINKSQFVPVIFEPPYIFGGSTHTIRKNTEALIIASNEICLEVNAEKTKWKVMSGDQNALQNDNIQTSSKFFERASQFKYLAITVKNQNSVHEKVKCGLKSRCACYHSV